MRGSATTPGSYREVGPTLSGAAGSGSRSPGAARQPPAPPRGGAKDMRLSPAMSLVGRVSFSFFKKNLHIGVDRILIFEY